MKNITTKIRYFKRLLILLLTMASILLLEPSISAQQYDTVRWATLKDYQTPEWFQDAKFGIYPHWGVYSVPAFGNEWYGYAMYDKLSQSPWYVPKTMNPHHVATYGDPGTFGYKEFIPMFKAEKFNADTFMSYVANAGAKYFVHLTSHHDAFLMYGSKLSRWNCVNMGPKKDVGLMLQTAAKKRGLRIGISNHLAENCWFFQFNWHNNFDAAQDTSLSDLYNDYNPSIDVTNTAPSDRWCKRWVAISEEMIDFFKPDYVYYDRGWSMHPKWTPYRKTLAVYQYNKAIEWRRGVYGAPGVALLYKDEGIVAGGAILDHENSIPKNIQALPFQCDQSISRNSWGYVENEQYWSTAYLITRMVDIVSKNGNMMLSINPKADGTLPDSTKNRLIEIKNWMNINCEAIYATRPAEQYGINKPNWIRFTRNKDTSVIYMFIEKWPGNNAVFDITPYSSAKLNRAKISKITMLGNGSAALTWTQDTTDLSITMPSVKPSACKYCYVFKVYLDNALTLPARPSNLTSISTTKGITLNWVNNSTKAKGFEIERKEKDSKTFKQIAKVADTITTYIDLKTSSEEAYVYRVRTYNAKGNSKYSNESTNLPDR